MSRRPFLLLSPCACALVALWGCSASPFGIAGGAGPVPVSVNSLETGVKLGLSARTFSMLIEGSKQGKFASESGQEGKIPCVAFSYEVQSPRDVATGQASGKRQHKPITITKEWGAASPQLYQALVTNEVLPSVTLEFLRTKPDGVTDVFQTVKLVNATVVGIKQGVGDAKDSQSPDTRELEEISLTCQRIEVANVVGKTTAIDDWSK